MVKASKPKKPPAALGVACDVCRAGVGVRCAETVFYKDRARKLGRKRLCGCGLVESDPAHAAGSGHVFRVEWIQAPVFNLVDSRCKTARAAKARAARKTELAEQREMFEADATDFKDAFPGAAS